MGTSHGASVLRFFPLAVLLAIVAAPAGPARPPASRPLSEEVRRAAGHRDRHRRDVSYVREAWERVGLSGGTLGNHKRVCSTIACVLGVLLAASPIPAQVIIPLTTTDAATPNLFIDWANTSPVYNGANPMDPEEIDVVRWSRTPTIPPPGGPNLTQKLTSSSSCLLNLLGNVEYFGNALAPPDAEFGGTVLVGAGTTGTWTPGPGANQVTINSSAHAASCAAGTTGPAVFGGDVGVSVKTIYQFFDNPSGSSLSGNWDRVQVTRTFTFATTFHPNTCGLGSCFRPYVPRLPHSSFSEVLYPTTSGLGSVSALTCPFGCTATSWDASQGWFAINHAVGTFPDGDGLIVRRGPGSSTPAALTDLWVDYDDGSASNASSILLLSPAGGFPTGTLTEEQWLCFYDSVTWPPAMRLALLLPPGCRSSTPPVPPLVYLSAVIRGTDDGIYHSRFDPGSARWSPWTALPGATADAPALTGGALDIVVRGTDNGIYHSRFDRYSATWSSWTALPGATAHAPTLLAFGRFMGFGGATLDLVVRGTDSGIYHIRFDQNGWGPWTAVPGTMVGTPALAITGQAELDLVVRGADNGIYRNHSDTFRLTWTGWTALPGATADIPALAATGGGVLHLVVRGTDNGIYHSRFDPGSAIWSPWTALPGHTVDTPVLASWGDGLLHLVVRGTDNGIYHNRYDGTSWAGWIVLPGPAVDIPALAASGGGVLDLLARGADHGIYHNRFDSVAWGGWVQLPGTTASKPALAVE